MEGNSQQHLSRIPDQFSLIWFRAQLRAALMDAAQRRDAEYIEKLIQLLAVTAEAGARLRHVLLAKQGKVDVREARQA